MGLRWRTPCDFGECPYDAQYGSVCEYWCGEDESEDYQEDYQEEEDDE